MGGYVEGEDVLVILRGDSYRVAIRSYDVYNSYFLRCFIDVVTDSRHLILFYDLDSYHSLIRIPSELFVTRAD